MGIEIQSKAHLITTTIMTENGFKFDRDTSELQDKGSFAKLK